MYKFLIGLLLLTGAAFGQGPKFNHYVDAVNGNDSNDGSKQAPWQTVSKALTSTGRVGFYSGSYGGLGETVDAGRGSRLTLKAMPGENPRISSVYLKYPTMTTALLKVEGFEITSDGSNMVYLKNARGVQIERCLIHAEKWARDGHGRDAFEVLSCSNILIRGNKVYEVHRGVTTSNTTNLTITHNYFRTKAGTSVQYNGGCAFGLIENNHFAGDAYVGYPDDSDAMDNPHSSIISIRSNDLIIRNNHLTGSGRFANTSGIMSYKPDAAGGEDAYSNILLENNVIYNTINTYAIRINNLGTNFVLRNNLVFSRMYDGTCNGSTSDARYRYSVAVQVHSYGSGYDGSGLELYNNVFLGIVSVPPNVVELNNIAWSWGPNPWLSDSPSGTSHIVTSTWGGCGNYSNFFETGFFKYSPDLWFVVDDDVDWSLADGSMGVNFGDYTVQPFDSLGSLGYNGFVQMNGPQRSSLVHSVGPLEKGGL